MLTILLLSLAAQTPAVRRTTPAADDPGMVVRQVGTISVNCTSGCSGGGAGGDGWIPDGGNIGYMKMPDGGPLEVYTVNSSGGSGGGWVPDGGYVGSVTVTGSVATTGPLTDTQLRAVAVPVSGTVTATGPLTDTQLRATPVPVSGTVTTGGLTDTQLRATAVPVSLTSTTVTGSVAVTGPVTDTQLRATPVPVSGSVTATVASTTITGSVAVTGPLTDTQLRATPVPVSGTVSTGGLTDTQLRATAVPVSLTSTTISSGTTTVTQGTGTNLHVVVDSAPSTVVTGPLTDTQLRATPVPVSGTVTASVTGATLAAGSAIIGNVRIDQTTPGTTNAVQANAGTNLNTSALGLETTLTKLPIAQSTALGSNSGTMVQGSVTTGAPAYTTGNINPLSLTTTGDLRTRPLSTGTIASALPTSAGVVGFSDGTNTVVPRTYDTDSSGAQQNTLGVVLMGSQFGGAAQVGGEAVPITGPGYTGILTNPIRKFSTVPAAKTVSCATTATAITASPLASRVTQCLMNFSSVTIFIGASGVTTAQGFPLLAGASFCDESGSQSYSCIVASGTADLRVLEN